MRVDGAGPRGRPATPVPPWHSPAIPAQRSQMSPRVFAGLVRTAEFALVAGIGFLIAYFYVADFFRQYAAALALAGFAAVTVFQSLGLYNMAALPPLTATCRACCMGWTATVALLLAGVFFLKIAPDFSRAWLALWYVSGAVALRRLPRRRSRP